MNFKLIIMPQATKDLSRMPSRDAERAIKRLEALRAGIRGNVKRLKDFTPMYRLRVGDYRALFDLEGATILVRRVLHRKDAYE